MPRSTIGFRLSASFATVVVLMAIGSAVSLWQLQIVRRQAQRLYRVDAKALAVLRVHTDVLTFRANLESLVDTRQVDRFAAEAAAHRAVFDGDVDRAIEALRATPGVDQPSILRLLETIRLNLPVHAADVTELARMGEWQAVRRRLENQVKVMSQVTGSVVEQIERDVAREQAETLQSIQRVQRQAAWTLLLTGLLTLVTAAALGTVATRRITRPLARLMGGARALAGGDFAHQVPDSGDEELQNLATVFNQTAAQLRKLYGALQRSAQEWEQTFDSIETPILLAGDEGRIARLNRAARDLAGRPYVDLIGRPLAEVEAGQPWSEAARLAALVAQKRAPLHTQVRDEASGHTWDLSAGPISGPAADGEQVVVVARDVTPMIELQESLRRSETLSAMGTLVAGVAHEVRNPLFGISANLDAFEQRFGREAEYAETIGLLRGELERLVLLMNDLLDYGRPACELPVEGSFPEMVEQALRACAGLARRSRVDMVNEVPAGLGSCLMDRRRMAQVLQNLLENAIQHSAEGAAVVVMAASETGRDGRAWINCSVCDSGPGFVAADLPHIFEPFFTRRAGGTGLGLSIVQRIVQLHGGTIGAANRTEGGAQLTLRVPRHGPLER
jgi:PAS domain S-box-containing protein